MPNTYLTNNWITFLRQYGPIPRNDNMYDESIQRVLRRAAVQPIAFPAPYLDELNENFQMLPQTRLSSLGQQATAKPFFAVAFGKFSEAIPVYGRATKRSTGFAWRRVRRSRS